MIIDPRGMDILTWSDFMANELLGYSNPPRLDDPTKWAQWALIVVQSPRIAEMNPPDPRTFTDWRQWAMRFNQAVILNT